jgi:branched-chain amino acid transport system permease protein
VSVFLSYTVIGITVGAIYAITATGLVITYTTTGIFNFAQGAVGMVAAFSFWQLWQGWGWNPVLSLAVVLLVLAPLLAIGVEFVFMRRLHGASTVRSLMVTLGLLVILVGLATAIWNPQVQRIVPQFWPGDDVTILGVVINYQQLLTVIVAVAVAVAMRYFFRWFRVGVAMRAVVDDPDLVALAGAKPHRVAQMGWMLGFFFAALAGCLIAPTVASTGLNIDNLTILVVNGYAAAVVGRLRSLPWTFVGAIALGLAGEYSVGYLSQHLPSSLGGQLPELVPVVFLFVALLVVPAARLAAVGRLPVHPPPRVANLRQSLLGAAVLIVAVAAVSPLLGGSLLAAVATGLTLGIVGLSLVLLTGFAGQVSLCQLTFLGVGAYVMGKVASGGGDWLGLVAAVAVTAGLGTVIALPAIRLRGLYLALATLAFGEAAYFAFFTNTSFFPGFGGSVAVGRLSLPGVHLVGDRAELIEIAAFFALSAVAVLAVRRSNFGRRLVAMNDSPAAFATLGLNATVTKVAVFALAAGMAGLGGVLYGGETGAIAGNDTQLQFLSSLILLLFVAIWGIRTTTGALLGGLSATLLPFAETHLPAAYAGLTGLVAGVGIVLLGRSADGVLGLPQLRGRVRLPFTDTPRRPAGDGGGADAAPTDDEIKGAVGVA